MAQWIGYHVDGHDPDLTVLVATGTDRNETMAKAVTRILSQCWVDGGILVQRRDDVDAETFQKLGEFLDGHFKDLLP